MPLPRSSPFHMGVASRNRLWANLILPEDVRYTQRFVLASTKEPKTRNRGPRHQSAEIEADDLIKVVVLALRSLSRDQKLWPFSPQSLHTLLSRIGATPFRNGPGLLTWVHFGQGERLTCCSRRKTLSWLGGGVGWLQPSSWKSTSKGSLRRFFCPRRHVDRKTRWHPSQLASPTSCNKPSGGNKKELRARFGIVHGVDYYIRWVSTGVLGNFLFSPRLMEIPASTVCRFLRCKAGESNH